MEKLITCIVNGKELVFKVTKEAYSKYINELSPANKIAPARNFLVRVVTPECKDDLRELMKLPAVDLQLAGSILEEYLPEVTIEMGESKSAPQE